MINTPINSPSLIATVPLETWVQADVDVNNNQVIATDLTTGEVITTSSLLSGLAIATVEEALMRSYTEDHGEVTRWLLSIFSEN